MGKTASAPPAPDFAGAATAQGAANVGWDNAKKIVEDEPRQPEKNIGKNSERHKAGVVGDTVGDPLKDTAGPALNPMIKVVNLVSVIIAPIIITFTSMSVWTVLFGLVLLGALVWAVMHSKRDIVAA